MFDCIVLVKVDGLATYTTDEICLVKALDNERVHKINLSNVYAMCERIKDNISKGETEGVIIVGEENADYIIKLVHDAVVYELNEHSSVIERIDVPHISQSTEYLLAKSSNRWF